MSLVSRKDYPTSLRFSNWLYVVYRLYLLGNQPNRHRVPGCGNGPHNSTLLLPSFSVIIMEDLSTMWSVVFVFFEEESTWVGSG